MKRLRYNSYAVLCVALCAMLCNACKDATSSKREPLLAINTTEIKEKAPTPLTETFKAYWYAGQAELTSYKLEQARYGEIREGHAMLIYVTENFLPQLQVKADYPNAKNIPVLKLNSTKKFNTGIYPYSIMQSTFYPVANTQHALKVSSSMQEWCGHVYAQLNNKTQFEITSHSYFEGEADKAYQINKATLENELWVQLRIDPKSLPVGAISCIPAFEYTRLKHKPIKAYNANASRNKNTYSLTYPELNRTLSITFNPDFPYDILGWEETFVSGTKTLTTKATKLKTIKAPYWQKNHNKDQALRDRLLLN